MASSSSWIRRRTPGFLITSAITHSLVTDEVSVAAAIMSCINALISTSSMCSFPFSPGKDSSTSTKSISSLLSPSSREALFLATIALLCSSIIF
uniref:CYP703A4 n=1 Tax=Arundo donax TaxID=35708 RepID=A0A0A9H924_ARUDO